MATSPTVRRRQLGMELERLRKAAKKNQEDAAEWLDVKAPTISRIEGGKQKVSLGQLRSLLQLYGVGSPHLAYLDQLRRESDQRGWWADYGKTVPSWFGDYLGMETAAAEVWTWEIGFIPGLLQTPEYIEAANATSSAAEVKRRIELKSARQRRLTGDEPLTLRAVIDEGALRRMVGGREVMRAQIRRIVEVAALPNVTVQVLPYSVGAHPGMQGAFTALRFPEGPMNTVYLELYGQALYLEVPAEVKKYTDIFEQLARVALDVEGTAELLDQIERAH